MKKIQIQMFYRSLGIGIFFLIGLSGCSSYPKLNECPEVDQQPVISFEDAQDQISDMRNEVNQKKRQIKKYNASV